VTELYSTALQTITDEFKNINPEITNALIFERDGEIIASNQSSTEDQNKYLIQLFNKIANQAETIGGLETLTIRGTDNQLNITSMNNRCLATISTREADEKIVKTFSHVLVPIVIKFVDQIAPEFRKNCITQTANSEEKPVEEITPVVENKYNEIPDAFPTLNSEAVLPEPPVSQFLVKKIEGLLAPSDTVRVDSEVVSKWYSLYSGKQIIRVHIETLEGKKGICKFKPMKNENRNSKGVIQIPQRILQALKINEGKLVIVKPVVVDSRG
jgi:predicted regulator of Ras-like GTPase activity (Roadblock/LC7/MglB family)